MTDTTSSDSYNSIAEPSRGIYRDSGSKLIALAYPVSDENQIREIISEVKKEYFDARHHCFAYRLGVNGENWRANDDGEPSSTAGRPILGQLLSNELSDILVIVVRYFGGTKLGVPGLIKAYKSATADALANSKIIEKKAMTHFNVRFGYMQMNSVMKVIKDFSPTVKQQIFDNLCSIEMEIRKGELDKIRDAFEKIEGTEFIIDK